MSSPNRIPGTPRGLPPHAQVRTAFAQTPRMMSNTTQAVSPPGEDAVERRVLEVIADRTQTPIEQITRDSRLVPELTDSLGATEVVMDLEEEFEGSIPDEAAEQIATVGQLIDHVKTHLASVSANAPGS